LGINILVVLEVRYTMRGFADPIRKGYILAEKTPSDRKDPGAKNGTALSLLTSRRSKFDDKWKSWSVCSHLSHPGSLLDYYMGSGSITILLGKCLCQRCHEMIVSKSDLTEVMSDSKHMTDRGFQKDFIEPLIKSNREFVKSRNQVSWNEQSQGYWICCPDVSRESQLEQLYGGCSPLFLFEGYVGCNDCMEVIPSTSTYLQMVLDCEAMTDLQFQQRIIETLYPINRAVLEAVGHYKR
jgi:hypothetical protein